MSFSLLNLNWLAIGLCVVLGQAFVTLWFAVIFARPWAKVYGVDDPKQHTSEIPGYTYAVGAGCVFLLSVGLASLQRDLGLKTLSDGLGLGLAVAIWFSIATALPGYAFLRRWRAFILAMGSQCALIMLLSAVLSLCS